MLLKNLCNFFAPSGCEQEISKFIQNEIQNFCDYKTDSMGNMLCFKKGKKRNLKKVLLCAHMDEVGFIITDMTDDGYLKFDTVGGLDSRILLGQKVLIGKNKINGIIGVKAIHLVKKQDRDKVVEQNDMYIDIGAKSKEDAQKYIEKGDYAVFRSDFISFGKHRVKGKALDDRAGCAILIDLIKSDLEYDTYFAFTVQEEVGLRGAKVIASQINPDICMVVEGTSCGDLPKVQPQNHNTTLGNGVAISNIDNASVTDIKLKQYLITLSEMHNINYQFKRTTNGGNDAGALFQSMNGVRTCTISVPCRYIHTGGCVMSLFDFTATGQLAKTFINTVGGEAL